MTISTSLLFSRAVGLMNQSQSDLASMQEKVATGKQVVRPSDGADSAVNIARLKNSISQFDSYKSSLQSTSDRLGIEESYLQSAADVLSSIKGLSIQGANGTLGPIDRLAIAKEVDELTAEMMNIANGTDANGNFLFGGSRNQTAPYQLDDDGIPRYSGDIFQSNLDFTSQRQSAVGRTGLEIFEPVLTGGFVDAKNSVQRIELKGAIEVGDVYTVTIDEREFSATVMPRDTKADIVESLITEINAANDSGALPYVRASNNGIDDLLIEGLNGEKPFLQVSTTNTDESLKRGSASAINLDTVLDPADLQFEKRTLDFSPPFDFSDIDDVVTLSVGGVSMVTTNNSFADLDALVDDFKAQVAYGNLDFTLEVDPTGDQLIVEWNTPLAVPNTTKVEFGSGGTAQASLLDITDNHVVVNSEGKDLEYGINLEGPFERGDKIQLSFEGVDFEYVIDGFEDADFPAPTNLGVATATNIELALFAGTYGDTPIDYTGVGAARTDGKSDRIHLTLTAGSETIELDTGSISQAMGGVSDIVNDLNAALATAGNTDYVISQSTAGNILVSRTDGLEFSVGLGINHDLDNETLGKVSPELSGGGVVVDSHQASDSSSVISLAFNDSQTSVAGSDLGIAPGSTFKIEINDENPAIGSMTLEVAVPVGATPTTAEMTAAIQLALSNAGMTNYAVAAGTGNNLSISRADGVAFSIEVVEGSALTSLSETSDGLELTEQNSLDATNRIDTTTNLYDALGAKYVSLRGVREALVDAINNDPLIAPKLVASEYRAVDENYVGDPGSSIVRLEPLNTSNPGRVESALVDRGDLNNQSMSVYVEQVASPAIAERIEFFEVLKNLSNALKADDALTVRAHIDQVSQMVDSITLSLADIGSEMITISDEININEDLKLQLQSALSSQEDLDYASAITELQAKMLSLEAAQSSFAKISQLSLFDYLR